MTNKRYVWAALVVLGVASVVLVLVSQRQAGVAPQAAAASTEPAPAPPTRVVAAGRVESAGETFEISSEVDGRLARVYVDEGDLVRAGQVVAAVANADYRARVELAKSEIAHRRAQLERLRNGSRTEQRKEVEAQLREAEASLASARREVDRRRPLLEPGAVSKSEFQLAVRDQTMAEARVDAARERLALVRDETRAEDIRQAEADLASAEARLSEAEALLQKTYVRSPIDGRVLHRWRKTGESVGAAMTPILSVADTAKLRVRVDVDETDVARIREGQRAWVTADAYPGRRFTGRVVRIGQVLGRKNVRTDEPTERVDKKVLETLVDLDEGQSLPLGLRVNVFLE
jgi:HlyD family secretion protein